MLLAEREGFEPPDPRRSTVFKTAAIDHSAISPKGNAKVHILFRLAKFFFQTTMIQPVKQSVHWNRLVSANELVNKKGEKTPNSSTQSYISPSRNWVSPIGQQTNYIIAINKLHNTVGVF